MTFLSKLKYAVLFSGIFCFSAGANAATATGSLLANAYSFSNSLDSKASFKDTFSFNLAGGNDLVSGLFNFNNLSNWTITLTDPKNIVLINQGDKFGGSGAVNFDFNNLQNIGTYSLVVSGKANGNDKGHNYAGSFSIAQVSPVPEAEAYAMMLAGLGLIGFIGRRRQMAGSAIAA